MQSFLSLYDILNVNRNSTLDEIKSSFRKLAKIHHPDKNNNSVESNISFITINNAYKILSNPAKIHMLPAFRSLGSTSWC